VKRVLILGVVAALGVVGCRSGGSESGAPGPTGAVSAATTGGAAPSTLPTPDSKAPDSKGPESKAPDPRKVLRTSTGMEAPRVPELTFKVEEPGTQGWKPAPTQAEEMARKVDRRLRELKDTSARTTLTVNMPQGKGVAHGEIVAKDPKTFYFDYTVLGRSARDEIARNTVLANGKDLFHMRNGQWDGPRPIKSGAQFAETGPDDWTASFSGLLLGAMAEERDTFGDFIAAAAKPGSGFQVDAEEKTTIFRNRPLTNGRILVRREPSRAEKEGALEIEFVLDAGRNLPVRVRLEHRPPGKSATKVEYQFVWNLAPNQRFDPRKFEVPKA
jgi:hypothetical protein